MAVELLEGDRVQHVLHAVLLEGELKQRGAAFSQVLWDGHEEEHTVPNTSLRLADPKLERMLALFEEGPPVAEQHTSQPVNQKVAAILDAIQEPATPIIQSKWRKR